MCRPEDEREGKNLQNGVEEEVMVRALGREE